MGEYCTIADLRVEDLYVVEAQETRMQSLIREMSSLIDRICGWHFDQRTAQTLKLSGTGKRFLHLPVPTQSVTEVRSVWRGADPAQTTVIAATDYVVYNRGFPTDDRFNPKLEYLGTSGFAKGVLNYEVDGDFGFVDEDPDNPGTYITPLAIKRACVLLVIANAGDLADPDAYLAKKNIDIRALTVQGRKFEWDGPVSSNTATGVPEVDRILAMHRQPMHMKAA